MNLAGVHEQHVAWADVVPAQSVARGVLAGGGEPDDHMVVAVNGEREIAELGSNQRDARAYRAASGEDVPHARDSNPTDPST